MAKKTEDSAPESGGVIMVCGDIPFAHLDDMLIGIAPLERITPHSENPRINDNAIEYVKKSIDRYRFLQPLVVISGAHPAATSAKDSQLEIVVGHTRYLAMIELGHSTAQCILADHLSVDEVEAYRIADNATGEKALWDVDLLKIKLETLRDHDFEMDLTGFDDFQIAGYLEDPWLSELDPDSHSEKPPDGEAVIRVKIDEAIAERTKTLISEALNGAGIDYKIA